MVEGPARGVLLIGIDGLRADHLAAYGYDRDTMPALEGLAGEGVRFTQMFSSSPVLIPAHISLLTGSHPGIARRFMRGELEGLDERRWRIPGRVSHLAVEFLASRYATAAFVDSPLLSTCARKCVQLIIGAAGLGLQRVVLCPLFACL